MSTSLYKPLSPLPSTDAEIQQFIDSEELIKPLAFARTNAFTRYLACLSWTGAIGSMGMSCFCPVSLFNPGKVAQVRIIRQN